MYLIAGCTATVKPLSKNELNKYSNVTDFIEDQGLDSYSVAYKLPYYDGVTELNEPSLRLSQYCKSIDGGEFKQLRNYEVQKGHDDYYKIRKYAKNAFGEFACYSNFTVVWDAVIDVKYTSLSDKLGSKARINVRVRDEKQLEAEFRQNQLRDKAIEEKRRVENERYLKQKEREERHLQATKSHFNDIAIKSKSIGDKVCTPDNKFGFVENISNEKIKINIIGAVPSKQHYFFFNTNSTGSFPFDGSGSFSYDKYPVEYIWEDHVDWAKCNFDF